MTTFVRRLAGVATAALLAASLTPVAAAPAQAEPGCLEETRPPGPLPLPGLPGIEEDGCDDSTPPETTAVPATPPNANGLVATSTMSFAVEAVVTDGDPGPFVIECALAGPAQAHGWRTCVDSARGTVTYSGLPDAPAGSYTFSARAVDAGDLARNPDNGLPPTVADTPDLDPSPATVTWGQDTVAPFAFVSLDAYDEETPTQPVVASRSVRLRLNASERGATFECTDKGVAVSCTGGRWELDRLRSGRHALRVRAIDLAGNASQWTAAKEFFVPTNLKRRRGWAKRQGSRWFDGDAVTTTRRGARLVLSRRTVGELRLYAATAPSHGRLRIRVGKGRWHTVNLKGKRAAVREIIVIDRYSGQRRGKVVIESLTSKQVVLDAIVVRPNRFPG